MPNGCCKPLANTVFIEGLALPVGTRNTCTEPDMLLATNKSPFGATRIARAWRNSDVTNSAEKPYGTCGRAPAGIGTTCAALLMAFEMGCRSCAVNKRLTPGVSACQLPNAAAPRRT